MEIKYLAGSPVLEPIITADNYKTAVTASSGGCLVADAIKEQYPHLSNVSVDVATVRVSDRKRGERYIYLTPTPVSETVLAFDQGWTEAELPKKLTIRKAVKIIPIIASKVEKKATAEQRQQRLLELEEKEVSGEELTREEKSVLTRFRNPRNQAPERPTARGPAEIAGDSSSPVIKGGDPIKTPKNPNLLRGRNRHFGAKTAKPSEVFERAVKEAVRADRENRVK